ncbi:hypothetical protein ACGFMM_10850 [Streptomyces sp. NPDC048604]|uniref:hypothetical protein n=1 Tax=Streptomyces sp. NPDC048604 TaxID=3365578 RepID=UPI003716C3ED
MTHRSRKLVSLLLVVIVLGFVLNNINARSRNAQRAAEAAKAEPGAVAVRPLAPLYVPRPASLISGGYGGSLSKESTPQQVTQAFAKAYVTYNPDRTKPDEFVAGLPRLEESARTKVRDKLADAWEKHLSKLGGDAVVSSVSDPDPAAQQNGEAETTAVLEALQGNEDTVKLKLKLEEGDVGWEVTSVELDGA